jgi:hypothetical protein
MQIIIHDEVKDFLAKKKSDVLTVSMVHSGGG